MNKTAGFAVAALGAILVVSSGCKRENPIDGIGAFRFGKSTLGDWGYACDKRKDGTTWCQNNPLEKSHHVSLGGQDAYVGALFAGTADDAPLAEIELHVEHCKADELRSWLKHTFGDPTTEKEGAVFWKKKILYIAAKVPPSGSECDVNFVEAKNSARISELQKRE
jgi:hypothetical protein